MSYLIRSATAIGSIVAAGLGRRELGRRYPAQDSGRLPGEIEVNGRKRVVVGYFGASQEVFNQGISFGRPLWFGSKAIAQSYAVEDAARSGTKPIVAVLVADRPPSESGDFERDEHGSFLPLSPEYLRQARAELVRHQAVTVANRQGLIGDLHRFLQARQNR